ncbi:MAG TPA: amidohydrolase family protein, partial [Thermoanaerobaculia bacterium]|nr:amidohydrolase family protein [Thermoanaerobaculia bacterium]
MFIGGTVVAGAGQTPQKNFAVYTSGGTIREVGPALELQRKYPVSNVIAVLNGTILPGLTDAHAHLYGLGVALDVVDLNGTGSYDEVIARVKQRADSAAVGEWIVGRGWDQNDWPGQKFPTRASLDAAVSDRPVMLTRIDGHATWVNSVALR